MIKTGLLTLAAAGLGAASCLTLAAHSIDLLQAMEKAAKVKGYRLMNDSARKGQTVFAGDSITDGYRVDEWYAQYTATTGQVVYNRGINGDTSTELLARWDDTVLALHPRCIITLIGTNDLAQGTSPATVAANVTQMLDRARSASPGCSIILMAVYPTNPTMTTRLVRRALTGKKTAESIRTLNRLLSKVAGDHSAIWLDLTSDLSDANGRLDPRYSFDGLHLNASGYAVVTHRIQTHLAV